MTRPGREARERLTRGLENDPMVGADVAAVDPALVARMAIRVQARIAGPAPRRRRVHFATVSMSWGALAASAAFGLWVGWIAPAAPPAPTLLAAVQITSIADPLP